MEKSLAQNRGFVKYSGIWGSCSGPPYWLLYLPTKVIFALDSEVSMAFVIHRLIENGGYACVCCSFLSSYGIRWGALYRRGFTAVPRWCSGWAWLATAGRALLFQENWFIHLSTLCILKLYLFFCSHLSIREKQEKHSRISFLFPSLSWENMP